MKKKISLIMEKRDLREAIINMDGIFDTLKTTGAGVSGWWLSISGWLPEIVSLGVGIATLMYLIIKIYKELK